MLFSLQKMWQWPHWIIHCHICHILCHKLIMPTTLTKIPIAFQKQLPKLYYLTNTHNFLFTQWGRNWKNSVDLNKMKIIGCVALLWHFQSVKIENVKIESVNFFIDFYQWIRQFQGKNYTFDFYTLQNPWSSRIDYFENNRQNLSSSLKLAICQNNKQRIDYFPKL